MAGLPPSTPFRVARLFDHVDPERGPIFAPDHPRVDDLAERSRLVTFLRGGTALLAVASRSEDRVDPTRGDRVPIVTKTDGQWIWSAGHAYYLQQYGLALEPEFNEHIRARGYIAESPNEQTLRAAAEFFRSYQAARHSTRGQADR